jgi:hypothetical protein
MGLQTDTMHGTWKHQSRVGGVFGQAVIRRRPTSGMVNCVSIGIGGGPRRGEGAAVEPLVASSPVIGTTLAVHARRWGRVGIVLSAILVWLALATEARADGSSDTSAETTTVVDPATVSSDELESAPADPVVSDPAPAPAPDPVVSDPAPAPAPDPVVSDPAPAPDPVVSDPAPAPAPDPVVSDPAPVPAPDPVVSDPAPAPVVDPAPVAPGDAPGDSIVVVDGPAASLGPSYVPFLEYAFDTLSGGLSMPALAADRGSGSATPAAKPGNGQVSSERPGRSPLPAPRPDSAPAPAPSGGAAGSSNGFSLGVFAALTALLALASQRLGGALRLTVTPLRPPLLVSHLKRPG